MQGPGPLDRADRAGGGGRRARRRATALRVAEMGISASARGAVLEYMRGALWVMPAVSVGVALLAGFLLSHVSLDERSLLGRLVFQGGADAARELLIVVSATMITVTGLVFTLTIVALQIASAQFSPRLLRNFLRDRGTQLVLSTFVGTFAYSLAGLHTVGSDTVTGEPFVPRLAITGALVLAMASVAMLVYFIHHIAHSIQIDSIMRGVERETLEVIDSSEPQQLGDRGVEEEIALPRPDREAVVIRANRSGYIQSMDGAFLVPVAVERDALVRLLPMVGDHVVAGTTLAWVWPREPDAPRPQARLFVEPIHAAVHLGQERTMQQDVAFGIRQLVDIALRAISPAINDPYTATQAVQHLAVILSALGPRRLTHWVWTEPPEQVRVCVARPGFADYLELACAQVRRFGAGEPGVVIGLLRLLQDVAATVTTEPRRTAVVQQTELLLADAEREIRQPADLVEIRRLAEATLRQAGRPETEVLPVAGGEDWLGRA